MGTITGVTEARDGTAIHWTAEFRVEGDHAVLEWIRTRTATDGFNTHWMVDSIVVGDATGGDLVEAVTAVVHHRAAQKFEERQPDRRHR